MFRVTEHLTYPFEVDFRPPEGSVMQNTNTMRQWLDKNVRWDGKLDILAKYTENRQAVKRSELHYNFRVASMEDALLVKLAC